MQRMNGLLGMHGSAIPRLPTKPRFGADIPGVLVAIEAIVLA